MGDFLKVAGLLRGGAGARTESDLDSQLRALSTSTLKRQLIFCRGRGQRGVPYAVLTTRLPPHLLALGKPFLVGGEADHL